MVCNMQVLGLQSNQIGDVGMQAFSTALASGALAQCHTLSLRHNQIGDVGLASLADACARGALASITFIDLDNNKASETRKQQMRNVAESRGFRVDLA